MLQFVHSLVQIDGTLIAHHQTVRLLVQLYEHLTAVLSVTNLLADGITFTESLLFLFIQFEVIHDVTMNGIGHQLDLILFVARQA